MWKRLRDETTWHGKAIGAVLSAPKVFVVLVFFAGVFAVIAVDSLVQRMRRRSERRVLRER